MTTIQVQASNARETTTGVETSRGKGVDVDVRVTLPDGRIVDGEVTLVPHEDGRPGWHAYGDGPDTWVSGALLADIYATCGDDYDTALDALESAAAAVVEA